MLQFGTGDLTLKSKLITLLRLIYSVILRQFKNKINFLQFIVYSKANGN